MGQRHQIYVGITSPQDTKNKNKSIRVLSAYHHQWLYGASASSKALKLCETIDSLEYDYDLHDDRIIDSLVKHVYGVTQCPVTKIVQVARIHNEQEHLIDQESGLANVDQGDNNDGCTLILIDTSPDRASASRVSYCLFGFSGIEGEHAMSDDNPTQFENWAPYSASEYVEFYYSQTQQAEMLLDAQKRVQELLNQTKLTQADLKNKVHGLIAFDLEYINQNSSKYNIITKQDLISINNKPKTKDK